MIFLRFVLRQNNSLFLEYARVGVLLDLHTESRVLKTIVLQLDVIRLRTVKLLGD